MGIAVLVLLGVLASTLFATHPKAATAATVSFSQCNNRAAGPGGAPLTVTCSVNIVNSITPTGNTSSVTFSRICTLNPCTGDVINLSDVVNAVHQCNGSDNVGGSRTVCSVNIINNIVVNGPAAASAITVSQCVGSGGGGGTNMAACVPSSQGSPTVVQCNGSGNGGGGAMTCSASGTTSLVFPVLIDQCNGSENGGGSFVTCTSSVTTNITVVPLSTATLPPVATLIPTPLPVATLVPTPLPGAPASPTLIPGTTPTSIPAAPATPITAAPGIFTPTPTVLFVPPQQVPIFIPPQALIPPPLPPNFAPPTFPPSFAPPALPVSPAPPSFVPVAPPIPVVPVSPPNLVPPVAPPVVPVAPVAPPIVPAAPPLPPQTGIVYPPDTTPFLPPRSGDAGLLHPSIALLNRLIQVSLHTMM